MAKKLKKTNPQLVSTIKMLKKKAWENKARIWKDLAERLERSLSNWAEVNLSRIERCAKDGDVIIVPGKLLGTGVLTKKVTIAAWKVTKSAREKVEKVGGKVISYAELIEKNPKGSGIKIMG
ncbi:MAG: 50S ribosomal protein L18e [Thermoplasmata archaeon]|nr:MAG: 50S ribosomal protein L18e [Thermoplasmata archaeon]